MISNFGSLEVKTRIGIVSMSNPSLYEVYNFFREVLDIPKYYCCSHNTDTVKYRFDYELYAYIGNISIYIISPQFQQFSLKTRINSRILICNDVSCYELLMDITDYDILIIDDIIKNFKGVFL